MEMEKDKQELKEKGELKSKTTMLHENKVEIKCDESKRRIFFHLWVWLKMKI